MDRNGKIQNLCKSAGPARPPRITVEFDYDIGDKVLVAPIGAAGIILSLWFSDRGVRYQVAWWDNANRYEQYLLPGELEPWKD